MDVYGFMDILQKASRAQRVMKSPAVWLKVAAVVATPPSPNALHYQKYSLTHPMNWIPLTSTATGV